MADFLPLLTYLPSTLEQLFQHWRKHAEERAGPSASPSPSRYRYRYRDQHEPHRQHELRLRADTQQQVRSPLLRKHLAAARAAISAKRE